ncbi:MAG: thioredoxin family protein [Planctomycetaceae bacterium]
MRRLKSLDEGLKAAQASGRDVLVNFTGLGWCHYCTLLERQVFSQPEFSDIADHFVLVELDFPASWGDGETDQEGSASDPNLPEAMRQQYRAWQSKYLITGFPTMVVMDARGKPIAYSGYEKTISPDSLRKELAEFRQTRISRDDHLQQAEKQAGLERAASLDAALEGFAPQLGSLKERNGDPLLSWYGDTISEILRLDAQDELGLRTKYEQRQTALQQFIDSEKVFIKLKKFKSHKDAIAYVDRILPEIHDDAVALRLELARQVYLEWDNQSPAALENARRLLERTDLTRDERDHLKFRVAFSLKNLGRFVESAAQLDEIIDANQDRPDQQLKFLNHKAWFLHHGAETGDDRQAAIAAFRKWRDHCEPHSEDWQTATWGLAIQYQKSGQFSDAMTLRQELVEFDESPESLLDLAETYISLAKNLEAEQTLAKAKQLMASIAGDSSEDKMRAERFTTRALELKQRIKSADE